MTSTIENNNNYDNNSNNNNSYMYKESSTFDNNNNNNKDDNNKELKKSLLINNSSNNINQEEEFQEIEIPIDDDYYSNKQYNTENVNSDGNNQKKEYNEYSIDIESDIESDEDNIVDYKSIQPNVIRSKNKVVLVIVSNKDGTLSLNAKYPRELSNHFSSSDYLQIKSEINQLKSKYDTMFNRLIVTFSVGGAICIMASLLLWYINSNFITVGTISCLSVGILLWLVFGLFIELKNHYRIYNRKQYFKELNERFNGQDNNSGKLKFRAKFDKSRHKNPIALIIKY